MSEIPDGRERMADNRLLFDEIANNINEINVHVSAHVIKGVFDTAGTQNNNLTLSVDLGIGHEDDDIFGSLEDEELYRERLESIVSIELLGHISIAQMHYAADRYRENRGEFPTFPVPIDGEYRNRIFLPDDSDASKQIKVTSMSVRYTEPDITSHLWAVTIRDPYVATDHKILKVGDTYIGIAPYTRPAIDELIIKASSIFNNEEDTLRFGTATIAIDRLGTLEEVMEELAQKYQGTAVEEELKPLFEEAIIRNRAILEARELQKQLGPNEFYMNLQQMIEFRDITRELV